MNIPHEFLEEYKSVDPFARWSEVEMAYRRYLGRTYLRARAKERAYEIRAAKTKRQIKTVMRLLSVLLIVFWSVLLVLAATLP